MESIYYVMSFACHRRCKHCYDDRFRPYVRGDLNAVVHEAVEGLQVVLHRGSDLVGVGRDDFGQRSLP